MGDIILCPSCGTVRVLGIGGGRACVKITFPEVGNSGLCFRARLNMSGSTKVRKKRENS